MQYSSDDDRRIQVVDDDYVDTARDDREKPGGAPRYYGRTVAISSYPTAVNVYYGVEFVTLTGDEIEGQPATEYRTGIKILAWNHGTTKPPLDSKVEVTFVPRRWTFRWDR